MGSEGKRPTPWDRDAKEASGAKRGWMIERAGEVVATLRSLSTSEAFRRESTGCVALHEEAFVGLLVEGYAQQTSVPLGL